MVGVILVRWEGCWWWFGFCGLFWNWSVGRVVGCLVCKFLGRYCGCFGCIKWVLVLIGGGCGCDFVVLVLFLVFVGISGVVLDVVVEYVGCFVGVWVSGLGWWLLWNWVGSEVVVRVLDVIGLVVIIVLFLYWVYDWCVWVGLGDGVGWLCCVVVGLGNFLVDIVSVRMDCWWRCGLVLLLWCWIWCGCNVVVK